MVQVMIFSRKWRWLPFFAVQIIAIALLWSYLNDTSFLLWRSLDESFFVFLNSSLNPEPGLWETFWAYTSTRIWDLISAFAIMSFYVLNPGTSESRRNFLGFLILLLLLMLFRENLFIFISDLVGKVYSPSLVMPDVIRLSELFPDITLKDKSKVSFPGDHAAVTILWCWLMWTQKSSQWVKIAALALTLLLVSPRLISGAHWLTDVIVGGGSLAMFVAAWAFYTPLAGKILDLLNPGFEKMMLLIGKITGLRYLFPFFRAPHTAD